MTTTWIDLVRWRCLCGCLNGTAAIDGEDFIASCPSCRRESEVVMSHETGGYRVEYLTDWELEQLLELGYRVREAEKLAEPAVHEVVSVKTVLPPSFGEQTLMKARAAAVFSKSTVENEVEDRLLGITEDRRSKRDGFTGVYKKAVPQKLNKPCPFAGRHNPAFKQRAAQRERCWQFIEGEKHYHTTRAAIRAELNRYYGGRTEYW